MLLATALALLIYRMCSTDVYCSKKQTGSSARKGNHPPSFLRFWIGQKKTVDATKFVAAQKIRSKTQQTFVNGLLGFIALGIYTPLGLYCVLLTIIAWVAHRYGQLYLHCSLIYFWVPSSCFAQWSASLWGWNNPVQRCLPVEGGCIIRRRRGGFTHWLTNCAVCNRRRPAATSSPRHRFQL